MVGIEGKNRAAPAGLMGKGYMQKVGFELHFGKIGGTYKSREEREHFWQKLKYTYCEKKILKLLKCHYRAKRSTETPE